jgi:hypothetical protein
MRERVIERLVERVPGATDESERAWLDEMLKDWIRAQQPAGVERAEQDRSETEAEYRTPDGEPLHKITVEFGGADEERSEDAANVPDYDPLPLKDRYSADLMQLWMRAAYEPWLDLPLERAAQTLSRNLCWSMPRSPLTRESVHLDWVRFDETESRALVFELYNAGVDVETLLAQIEAFPYDDGISLAWLTDPEVSIHMHTTLVEQMDEKEREMYPESLARMRHNTEFIFRVAALIPPHIRIWLRGWIAAHVHTAFARAVGLASGE